MQTNARPGSAEAVRAAPSLSRPCLVSTPTFIRLVVRRGSTLILRRAAWIQDPVDPEGTSRRMMSPYQENGGKHGIFRNILLRSEDVEFETVNTPEPIPGTEPRCAGLRARMRAGKVGPTPSFTSRDPETTRGSLTKVHAQPLLRTYP